MLNESISDNYENSTTLKDEINKLSKFKSLNHPHKSTEFLKNIDHVNLQFYQQFNKKFRRNNVKILIVTNSIDLFKCILRNLLEEVFLNDKSLNINFQLYKSIKKIMDFIIYSSESSSKFSEEICKNNHLLDLLYKIIDEFTTSGLNGNLSKHHIQILNDSILILHNILINGSRDKTMIIDDTMKFPKIICPLVQCPYDRIKLTTLLFMANVPNKDPRDTEKLSEHFSYIIQLLDQYLIYNKYEIRTYSIIELAKGIEKLSKFDEYKRPLVTFGLLDVLIKLIDNESSKYKIDLFKKLSLSILWNLAFNKENREDIIRMFSGIISNIPRDTYPSLYGTLTNNEKDKLLNRIKDKSIGENKTETDRLPRKTYVNILDGLNWILQDHQNISESEKLIENEENDSERESHFMFSYSHSNKKIVMEIFEELQKNGYNLWIDKYNINEDDNIMEAMAQAVENSVAVIIFMSSKYKSSEYCRSEAQYAFKLAKPRIPVIVESNYNPDGWLGFCTSGLKYVDFTNKNTFREAMSLLIEQLSATKSRSFSRSFEKIDFLKLSQVNKPDLNSWTHKQVKIWFKKIGIRKIKWKKLYDGREIMFLKRFPLEQFTNSCKEYFQMSDIREIRILYEELEKL